MFLQELQDGNQRGSVNNKGTNINKKHQADNNGEGRAKQEGINIQKTKEKCTKKKSSENLSPNASRFLQLNEHSGNEKIKDRKLKEQRSSLSLKEKGSTRSLKEQISSHSLKERSSTQSLKEQTSTHSLKPESSTYSLNEQNISKEQGKGQDSISLLKSQNISNPPKKEKQTESPKDQKKIQQPKEPSCASSLLARLSMRRKLQQDERKSEKLSVK